MTDRKRRAIRTGILIFLILAAILLCWFLAKNQNSQEVLPGDVYLEVRYLDVGQGDSILLITPDGCLLIDTGTNASEKALRRELENAGVESLEYLILTHPHADHIGGADMVLTEFEVEHLITNGESASSGCYREMVAAADASGDEIEVWESGDVFPFGRLLLSVLGPTDGGTGNNGSLVIRVDLGETSFLFTGDAETKEEMAILASELAGELDCDVLKVGHHGSSTSTSEDWLAAVTPNFAVISCGEGNSYGHPSRKTLDKLEEDGIGYARTDLEGTIILCSDGLLITRVFANP